MPLPSEMGQLNKISSPNIQINYRQLKSIQSRPTTKTLPSRQPVKFKGSNSNLKSLSNSLKNLEKFKKKSLTNNRQRKTLFEN